MTSYRFRKSQRVVSEGDFRRVLSRKCFVCRGMMRLYAAANALGAPRFGVSVSKSCGNAVARNRLKRFGREVFRLHQHEFSAGFDYILIFTQKKPKKKVSGDTSPKGMSRRPRYQDIESALLAMLETLGKKLR